MIRHKKKYATSSIIIHWIVALFVLSMLCVSFYLGDLPKNFISTGYMLHKSVGLTVLGLMLIRILLIMKKGRPPLPLTVPVWEKKLSRFVQLGLYFMLLLMPISGYLMSAYANKLPQFFNLFNIPNLVDFNKDHAGIMKLIHNTTAWFLIAFVALHILGALKHYFYDKDEVTQSMLLGDDR